MGLQSHLTFCLKKLEAVMVALFYFTSFSSTSTPALVSDCID